MARNRKPELTSIPTDVLETMCEILSLVGDMSAHQQIAITLATEAEANGEQPDYEDVAGVALDWVPLIQANMKQLVGQLEETEEGIPELDELLEQLKYEGDEDDIDLE